MVDTRIHTINNVSDADIRFLERGIGIQTALHFILPDPKADSLSREEKQFLEELSHNKNVSEICVGPSFGIRSYIAGSFFNGLLHAVSANRGACIKSLTLTNFWLYLSYDNTLTFINLLSAAFRCDALLSFTLKRVGIFFHGPRFNGPAGADYSLEHIPALLHLAKRSKVYLADGTIIGHKSALEHALFHSNSLKEINVPGSPRIFKLLQLKQNTTLIFESLDMGVGVTDLDFYYELSRILPKIHLVNFISYNAYDNRHLKNVNMYLFFLKSLPTLNSLVKLKLEIGGSNLGGVYTNQDLQEDLSASKFLGDFVERAEMLESCDISELEPIHESLKLIFKRIDKTKKSRGL